jgi:hypothetical protein
MNIIHPEMLKQLRSYYTPGTRVMLLKMNVVYGAFFTGDRIFHSVEYCFDAFAGISFVWNYAIRQFMVYSSATPAPETADYQDDLFSAAF